jgi:hypothetical protein
MEIMIAFNYKNHRLSIREQRKTQGSSTLILYYVAVVAAANLISTTGTEYM